MPLFYLLRQVREPFIFEDGTEGVRVSFLPLQHRQDDGQIVPFIIREDSPEAALETALAARKTSHEYKTLLAVQEVSAYLASKEDHAARKAKSLGTKRVH